MKVIELASAKSVWRGYEYYEDKKVANYKQIGTDVYQGGVHGSNNVVYNVTLNVDRPKKSTCNCPFANGRHVVCKHAVALYFTLFPDYAIEYKKQVDIEQEEDEDRIDSLPSRIVSYVRSLTNQELQNQLLDVLFESDESVLLRYANQHHMELSKIKNKAATHRRKAMRG